MFGSPRFVSPPHQSPASVYPTRASLGMYSSRWLAAGTLPARGDPNMPKPITNAYTAAAVILTQNECLIHLMHVYLCQLPICIHRLWLRWNDKDLCGSAFYNPNIPEPILSCDLCLDTENDSYAIQVSVYSYLWMKFAPFWHIFFRKLLPSLYVFYIIAVRL